MLTLLLAYSAVGVAATQSRLDQLVEGCGAEAVVRLAAHSAREVVIEMKHVGRVPSSDENRRFECVFKGMCTMTDLQFGFIGNEAYVADDTVKK